MPASVNEKVADLILDILEQGVVTEEFALDLCEPLCVFSEILSLDRVRARNRPFWAKLTERVKSKYGDFNITEMSHRDVGRMFVEAASEGFFSEHFMEELRQGLRELEERGTSRKSDRTRASNMLCEMTPEVQRLQ